MEFKKLPKKYSNKSKIHFSSQRWNYSDQTLKGFHLFATLICIIIAIAWLYSIDDSIAIIICGSFYTFMFCKHFIELLNVRKNR